MQGLDKQWNFLNGGLDIRGLELAGAMQRLPFQLDLAVNAGGTQATVQELALSTFSAYTVCFTDINGVEAQGTIAAISTPVNINTSALDPANPWYMRVILQAVSAGNPDLAKSDASFGYTVNTPKSAAIVFDNTAGAGTPSLQIDGTTVADGGTYNAGSVSVGDVVKLQATIQNTETADNGAFILESVSISGDGSFFATGLTPASIAPLAESNAWEILMDTSAPAAPASATFVFTSTRSTNASYSITIELTVA